MEGREGEPAPEGRRERKVRSKRRSKVRSADLGDAGLWSKLTSIGLILEEEEEEEEEEGKKA
jgi:hypothetical protein